MKTGIGAGLSTGSPLSTLARYIHADMNGNLILWFAQVRTGLDVDIGGVVRPLLLVGDPRYVLI